MAGRVEVVAGVPASNAWLFHRAPFAAGDPAAHVTFPDGRTVFLVRDIEAERARAAKIADSVRIPAEFEPKSGFSGDRETATAQALAEMLRREEVREVWADRSLPLIFAHFAREAGVEVRCDPELGVLARRSKSAREVEALREAQRRTEAAVRFACERIARADADADGALRTGGNTLTAERLRSEISVFLLEQGMDSMQAIVAPGREGGDCHNLGAGPIRTGEPVIIDVFPRDPSTRFFGDCTRTVVHGKAPEWIVRAHAAVVAAKAAATGATRAGATAGEVHGATVRVIEEHGYRAGFPERDDELTMPHGTGHGVGLDVHEPPLLDRGGPELVEGDCVTIEPGLYAPALGGVRVEDMVIVRKGGAESLSALPEGLAWA